MTDSTQTTPSRIPVTLLTGFLGAGKTTLLNAVLSNADGPKIAVVVNEFGEAGLDHDLIAAVDEEIVLMQSGCLCCSIRGDLSQTLQDLVARQNENRLSFDRVVIETTDLADTGRVPVASLRNLSGIRPQNTTDQALAWLAPKVSADPFSNLSGFVPTSVPAAPAPQHDAPIGSASIVLDTPIPVAAFDLWLDTLIKLRGPDILRVKGIVHLEDVDMPFVFHGVQHLFDPPVPLRDWHGDTRQSRIVVIARDMTRAHQQNETQPV